MLVVSALALCLNLIGCSPKWKAPVESRTSRSSYPANTPRPGYYYVQRGDSLAVIAWRWGMDWRALAAWNGIGAPYTIYPGQRLRLTPPRTIVRHPSPAPAARPSQAATKPMTAHRRPQSVAARPAPSQSPPADAETARSQSTPPSPLGREDYPQQLRWIWPADGQISSTFVPADEARKGIKISGAKGRAITAAEAGKVVYSGSGLIGYGRLIIIKHNNEFLSAYGHNRKLLVKEGDWVAKGDKIAEMGLANNGQAMLHFEIRRNGKPVNPVALLPRRAG